MMKSIRSRLTVTFIGLIAVILAVIWGVNKWYLEDFYVTKKVQALNGAYEAIDSRIEENKENGISIEDAMRREKEIISETWRVLGASFVSFCSFFLGGCVL